MYILINPYLIYNVQVYLRLSSVLVQIFVLNIILFCPNTDLNTHYKPFLIYKTS